MGCTLSNGGRIRADPAGPAAGRLAPDLSGAYERSIHDQIGHSFRAAPLDAAAAIRPPDTAPPPLPPERRIVTPLVRPVEHPPATSTSSSRSASSCIREVAAESERPVLLFSGGKDSAVLLHLAVKAFRPGQIPFPIMHIDTGHNFPEVIAYRDARVAELGEQLIVARVQDSIDRGRVRTPGRGIPQPAAGGHAARRHHRAPLRRRHRRGPAGRGQGPGQGAGALLPRLPSASGTPSASAPSCGSSTRPACGRASTSGPSRSRTGPSSTSGSTSGARASSCRRSTSPTAREVVERDGMLLALASGCPPGHGEEVAGDRALPHRRRRHLHRRGALRGRPRSSEIIGEVAGPRISERGATRADDRFSETAMEDRKREGYF